MPDMCRLSAMTWQADQDIPTQAKNTNRPMTTLYTPAPHDRIGNGLAMKNIR